MIVSSQKFQVQHFYRTEDCNFLTLSDARQARHVQQVGRATVAFTGVICPTCYTFPISAPNKKTCFVCPQKKLLSQQKYNAIEKINPKTIVMESLEFTGEWQRKKHRSSRRRRRQRFIPTLRTKRACNGGGIYQCAVKILRHHALEGDCI